MPSRFGFRTSTGQLYSVSPLSLTLSLTHSHTDSLYLCLSHSLTLSFTMYVCTCIYLSISLTHTHTHTHNTHTQVMFKLGDDLRQDQLILQLITLMDRILRRENLDLKLTPYNVLACSSNHGLYVCVCGVRVTYCTYMYLYTNSLVQMCVYRYIIHTPHFTVRVVYIMFNNSPAHEVCGIVIDIGPYIIYIGVFVLFVGMVKW